MKRTRRCSLSRSDRPRRIHCQKCGGLIMKRDEFVELELDEFDEEFRRCLCNADGQDQESDHLDSEES